MTELRLTTAGRRRGMKKRRRDADKLARRTDGLAGESSAKRRRARVTWRAHSRPVCTLQSWFVVREVPARTTKRKSFNRMTLISVSQRIVSVSLL